MNRRAKFDAASFIVGREIRNRTYTHMHKQTVTDLSTLCLLACDVHRFTSETMTQICMFTNNSLWVPSGTHNYRRLYNTHVDCLTRIHRYVLTTGQ